MLLSQTRPECARRIEERSVETRAVAHGLGRLTGTRPRVQQRRMDSMPCEEPQHKCKMLCTETDKDLQDRKLGHVCASELCDVLSSAVETDCGMKPPCADQSMDGAADSLALENMFVSFVHARNIPSFKGPRQGRAAWHLRGASSGYGARTSRGAQSAGRTRSTRTAARPCARSCASAHAARS